MDAEKSGDRYRVLLEINNAIISNLTRDTLLHSVAETLRHVVSFDRAALMLYDRRRDVFRVFAWEGRLLPGNFADVNTEINSRETGSGLVFG